MAPTCGAIARAPAPRAPIARALNVCGETYSGHRLALLLLVPMLDLCGNSG
jgi:hypothetical protein